MQREEFDLRVRMLLPQASEAALESYAPVSGRSGSRGDNGMFHFL